MTGNIRPVDIRFSDKDAALVAEMVRNVLRSGRLTLGPVTERLEQKVAALTDRKYAVALASGTAALEVMLRACILAGLLTRGEEILMPTNTFIATLIGAKRAGIKVRLVDTGFEDLNSTLDSFTCAITSHTRAICAVHIGGYSAPDALKLASWAWSQELLFFEDAAHALGVMIGDKPAGSLGIAAAFSLFATKVATSAEGGIMVTDDEAVACAARKLRDHGKDNSSRNFHVAEAYNWRLSEIQAVVGCVSIDGLENRLARRRKMAAKLTFDIEAAGSDILLPLIPVSMPETVFPNWYKYVCLLPNGADRDLLKRSLAEQNIICGGEVYETPLHLQPVVRQMGFLGGPFPNAEDMCGRHICLPLHERMDEADIAHIVAALQKGVHK